MMTTSPIALLLLAGCAVAFALSSTGTLTGMLTDPSRANLRGVSIEVTAEETGVTECAVSNQAGEYTFPLLPPGHYRLVAQAQGFRTYTHAGIVMESGRVTRLDIGMELGKVSEAIDVKGRAPQRRCLRDPCGSRE